MDFGLAFSFAFKDPDWLKKIALAGLVSLIPIIGQIFIIGWGLEVTRRVIRHEPELLPDLDFGENLSKGFQAFVISLVYSIPIILFSLIINISTALAANQQNGDTAAVVIAAISVCCGGLMLIYGIALGFWIPAAFGPDQGRSGRLPDRFTRLPRGRVCRFAGDHRLCGRRHHHLCLFYGRDQPFLRPGLQPGQGILITTFLKT